MNEACFSLLSQEATDSYSALYLLWSEWWNIINIICISLCITTSFQSSTTSSITLKHNFSCLSFLCVIELLSSRQSCWSIRQCCYVLNTLLAVLCICCIRNLSHNHTNTWCPHVWRRLIALHQIFCSGAGRLSNACCAGWAIPHIYIYIYRFYEQALLVDWIMCICGSFGLTFSNNSIKRLCSFNMFNDVVATDVLQANTKEFLILIIVWKYIKLAVPENKNTRL